MFFCWFDYKLYPIYRFGTLQFYKVLKYIIHYIVDTLDITINIYIEPIFLTNLTLSASRGNTE